MSSAEIDWSTVKRVLVVRLRSIGDTVLATASLIALRRFLPDAQIDILLEDWVAPVLTDFDSVDNILTVGDGFASRLATAREIRRRRYDVVFNLHGGTTGTLLVAVSGARHRVGYRNYQYSFLHNHRLSSPFDFWKRDRAHSAEQQLALLGFVGVPVSDLPKTRLAVSEMAVRSLAAKFEKRTGVSLESVAGNIALLHPAAAYETKQWAADKFARVAEFLASNGMRVVAVAAANERDVLDALRSESRVPVDLFDDLSLPEITALSSASAVFVGNDSGIAHIAAAVGAPALVIFGSSNRDHWRPWTDAPHAIVFRSFECQPCPGRECKAFGSPRCILELEVPEVLSVLENLVLERKRAKVDDLRPVGSN